MSAHLLHLLLLVLYLANLAIDLEKLVLKVVERHDHLGLIVILGDVCRGILLSDVYGISFSPVYVSSLLKKNVF